MTTLETIETIVIALTEYLWDQRGSKRDAWFNPQDLRMNTFPILLKYLDLKIANMLSEWNNARKQIIDTMVISGQGDCAFHCIRTLDLYNQKVEIERQKNTQFKPEYQSTDIIFSQVFMGGAPTPHYALHQTKGGGKKQIEHRILDPSLGFNFTITEKLPVAVINNESIQRWACLFDDRAKMFSKKDKEPTIESEYYFSQLMDRQGLLDKIVDQFKESEIWTYCFEMKAKTKTGGSVRIKFHTKNNIFEIDDTPFKIDAGYAIKSDIIKKLRSLHLVEADHTDITSVVDKLLPRRDFE